MTDTVIDLQIKISYMENTVNTLSDIIAKQDRQLQDLQGQLQLIYRYLQGQHDDGIAPFDLLADKPPHY